MPAMTAQITVPDPPGSGAGPGGHHDRDWVLGRLRRCLADRSGTEADIRDLHRVSSGFSWITWTFRLSRPDPSGGRDLVLRIGPPDGLLAPYSAEREGAILAMLAGRDVPVPATLVSSDDPAPFGAPFLICERMGGTPFVPWTIGTGAVDGQVLADVLHRFVRCLGSIHSTPWAGGPAAALAGGTTEAKAATDQIAYWETRYRENQTECLPIVEWALDWLKRNAPVAPCVALLHGDYRIGNFLTEGRRITAILDWEMAHFGDPHEDLAWAMYPPFGLPRLMDRTQVYALYRESAGIPISEKSIAYYSAFNLLKTTVINTIGLGGFLRRSTDMRLAALAFMTASQLAQLTKAVKAAQ